MTQTSKCECNSDSTTESLAHPLDSFEEHETKTTVCDLNKLPGEIPERTPYTDIAHRLLNVRISADSFFLDLGGDWELVKLEFQFADQYKFWPPKSQVDLYELITSSWKRSFEKSFGCKPPSSML